MKISKPQREVLSSTAPITLFLAGVGSGKSHIAGIVSIKYIKENPEVKGFIGANTHLQLSQSTLTRIFQVWASLGVYEYNDKTGTGHYVVDKKPPKHFHVIDSSFREYYGIISFINGCSVFIGSMENAKAHDGKEFGWGILDETKDTRESDVKEVIIARLRQKGIKKAGKDICPLYIFTSPAKVKWLNEWFEMDNSIGEITRRCISKTEYYVSRTVNKKVIISSTFHNLSNLPEGYIENIQANNSEERSKALIYGYPFSATGGEYYSSFSIQKHVSDVQYMPEKALHVSFDQNVNPYTPALVAQIDIQDDYIYVNFIDEVIMKHPNNNTEACAKEVLKRYYTHNAGAFVYGDSTGKRRLGATAEMKTHYEIIFDILKPLLSNTSNRVGIKNEPHLIRQNFVNSLLEGKHNIIIRVNKKCKYFIDDLLFIKQNSEGGKHKETAKDENKITYEKYGHLSDCGDYLLTEAFRGIYETHYKKK